MSDEKPKKPIQCATEPRSASIMIDGVPVSVDTVIDVTVALRDAGALSIWKPSDAIVDEATWDEQLGDVALESHQGCVSFVGSSKVGGTYAEQFGAPKGCLCTWLVRPTFVGPPIAERGPGFMPCPVHPEDEAAAPGSERSR